MKKTLLIAFLCTAWMAAYSQRQPVTPRQGDGRAPMQRHFNPGTPEPVPAIPPAVGYRVLEQQIGLTKFDIQTVASLGRRVGEPEAGKVSAIWQIALDQAGGYPDRGTAYNHNDGTGWGPEPDTRIEALRSGYPSFTTTADGQEVAISHKALTATSWELTAYNKTPGETTWEEHVLPSNVPAGNVWAKIAAGGPDGNTLHVLGISLNPSFGGVTYEGIDNHPLYWRSVDGGQSWDVQDFIIPGLDSNFYSSISSEAYTIEANGETVAVAVLEPWGDLAVFKSTDNGDTWSKTIVNDFPMDKWDGSPYLYTDIPADPSAPDSISMFTTDGSGSLVVDDQGKVHLFFGEMYVYGLQDSMRYLHLGTNGIGYWNEDMNSFATIAGAEDFDGDQTITVGGDIGTYRYSNSGAASFPTAATDDEGNLYLVYMAFHEGFTNVDGLTYRHIFITKSEDGGDSWSPAFDLVNPEITDSPEFVEAAYPSIPPRVRDRIQLIYQQDYQPGLTATNVTVPEQYIMHAALDKNTFGLPSAAVESLPGQAALSLSPNPAQGTCRIAFQTDRAAQVQAELADGLGRMVRAQSLGGFAAGQHQADLSLLGLPNGVYALRLRMGNDLAVAKLVVR